MNDPLSNRRRISVSPAKRAPRVGHSRIGVVVRALPFVITITVGCSMGTRGDSTDVFGDARDAGGTSSEAGPQKPASLHASCGNGVREVGEDCDEGTAASNATACSQRCKSRDLLVAAPALDGGVLERTLGAGRHPIAAGASGFAIAIVESAPSPRLVLRTFDTNGLASGASVVLDAACGQDANPSIAALSGNRYAIVWTDTAIDERDVALRVVDATTLTAGPLYHANARTTGSQYDADLAVLAGQIVVAWTDTQAVATAPDVSYRVFDATTFAPTTVVDAALDDASLAATPAVEGAVALTPFGSGWAAAWRDEQSDGERLQVRAGSTRWTIGPFVSGASGDRAALASLDGSHLIVAYSESTDPRDSGVVDVAKLRGAVLDVGAPGSIAPFWVSPAPRAQDQPNAVLVGATPFLTWRTAAATGDSNAEELWLKPLAWNGATLDVSAPVMPLPRWSQHQSGDQRAPALAASAIAGGALVTAWVDFGKTFGGSEGQGDIAFQLAPVPIVRGAGTSDDPPCPTGQRYCDSQCTSTSLDVANCGNCGTRCDAPPGSTASCVAGQCVVACSVGSHNCAGQCVSSSSIATCGGSCAACPAPPVNAHATCDGTSCGVVCDAGFHLCGGACVRTDAVTSCGISCTPCAAPGNGHATCNGTSCGVACNTGFHSCAAACADDMSPLTCGGSCTPCAAPANGSGACTGGLCTVACNAGFSACGGQCLDANDPALNPCLVSDATGVFASTSLGSALGDGTRARPVRTLAAAIALAGSAGKRVYACGETYAESITLTNGVSMLGSFSCAGGVWSVGAGRATINAPSSPAVVAAAINAATRFEGFNVLAPNAGGASQSSIGLLARNASALTIRNARIQAGNGSAGADGVAGVPLTQAGTLNGTAHVGGVSNCLDGNGQAVDPSLNGGNGGAGGDAGTRIRNCSEGAGGACFWEINPPGDGGDGFGPAHGTGGIVGGAAPTGGGIGAPGQGGASSSSGIGAFDGSAGYRAINGGYGGTSGQPGSGGGGAPGVAATANAIGKNGSGGGAGGCPGLGAFGAQGGGASVAVLSLASPLQLQNVDLISANGGSGGRGMFGSSGTPGGTGGGSGGAGGAGGASGSGGGGPSIALAYTGGAPVRSGGSTSVGAGGASVAAQSNGPVTIPASAGGLAAAMYAF